MNTLLKKTILFFVIIITSTSVRSQDKENPWLIGFGINAVDFYSVNISGMKTEIGLETVWFDQFFNLNNHYNYVTAPTKLTIGRYINKNFNVVLSASINKITQWGNVKLDNSLSYFQTDINFNYDLNNVIGETSWFDPYVIIGGGVNIIGSKSSPAFNGGLGTKLWVYKNWGVNIQTEYKHLFDNDKYRHFQHSFSIVYKLGSHDKDGDGVKDNEDNCPEIAGLKELGGCPDADQDGIPDADDLCPTVYGTKALKGCPDTDNDGVRDKYDKCPLVKGNPKLNGCPDFDRDGIIDMKDACPKIPGPISNNGCPEVDTDLDGVIDKLDKCKLKPGPISNNGCPDNKKELEVKLAVLASDILFLPGTDIFYAKYENNLNQIAELMRTYNHLKFLIEGHTDRIGTEESNLELSLRRANKIVNYLVSRGVNKENFTIKSFGETKPIASNNTREGRAKNRRVEIKIVN
ncbi:OmpA family protein [Lutibacter sp.]